ncbi:MAG: hypothetical protein PVI78_04570 [Anaerolineales bacterium]|jgi:hypothetical protein
MRRGRERILVLSAAAFALAVLACDLTATPTPEQGTEPPFVPATPTETTSPDPGTASISGVMWHELCNFTGGQASEPVVLGAGCEQWGLESWQFGPNQVYDDFEVGWSGVTLHLGPGACPSTGMATVVTNTNGEYTFEGLLLGTYCVSYDPLSDGNDVILIPGGPTYPIRGEAGRFWTVELTAGEIKTGVDFGYAWQFFD